MTGALPPIWDADGDADLVCVAVRAETHDVSTFVFAPVQPRLFRFLPGQFMTLELDAAGVQRSYTIASPPTRPWRIEVTAKLAEGGPGSAWLHGAMRPGVRVRASGPMGEFSCGMQPTGKLLLLSAGSGITPLMSMARTLHDLGSEADVLFLHSARSPADLVFAEELRAMERRPGFRSVAVVERDAPGARWDGFRGRLSPAMLGLLAPDLREREVFCCGPAPYMAAVRAMLDAAGADPGRYHEESFSFEDADASAGQPSRVLLPLPKGKGRGEGVLAAERRTAGADGLLPGVGDYRAGLPPHPSPLPEGEGAGSVLTHAIGASQADCSSALVQDAPGIAAFTVRFARLGRDIACPPGASVLAAARAAGVRLPSACGKGVCGTCKSRVLSGTVEMRHGGGIRQREVDAGLALLCCARPTSDLVVDR